ncbi:transglycosylase domain-containing protein [Luteolibacter sp. GHJ8]|uniref:peptidoglycan glycosyltransferase n=1 Tax=Luteolibacter rhizosphaerae TaxID=2989719 RepID=A0ABT3FXS1_9BACT|nr:transglycosylase domain-containing protein [Luteolibacter rhizosphaerae]MCW1912076.1 transglycosylase domain-containing protein [Luteolibacter rhizosphaerae]
MGTTDQNKGNKVRKRRFYKRKGFWLTLITLGVLGGGIGYVGFEKYTEPYRERAQTYDLARINDLEIPSIILDRNSQEIGRIFVQNRSIIPIAEVPKIFVDALKAGEDQRFDTHTGVDYIGVVRAVWLNFQAGETTQGASTITQQLARNAYNLEEERKKRNETGMERKIVEAFLAQRIERHFKNKSQILEFYLNRIYFGSGYYGIRSASLGYFGKEPKDLTALESAAIVGCIKNPTGLSPINNPDGNRKSRNLVLGRMGEAGAITPREAARLQGETLKLNPKPLQRGTTHLYERVADEIRRVLGDDALAAGGFRIHTSIDAKIQAAMENGLRLSLDRAEAVPGYANQKRADFKSKKSSGIAPEYLQGAGLMIDHGTGEVLAHVGGRDYADVPYDVIELGRRPLGTAFLPFVYAAGIQQGLSPATTVDDEPMDNRSVMVGGREGILGEWGMEVSRPTYDGRITARRALESSKIAASVRFAGMAGLGNVVKTAENFGLPMKDVELLPRIAAGWEAASMRDAVRAISAFARGGTTAPRSFTLVTEVENAEGHSVYSRKIEVPVRLEPVDDATAFIVHDMMRGSMEDGSARGLSDMLVEKPFSGAGKTGTTHDFSDNWFLGYNGRVSCGIWVGFLQPNKTIYEGAFSRDLAMPVWADAMNAAASNFGGKVIQQPASVAEVKICSVSGQRATPYCYETIVDPATNRPRTRSSEFTEFFRKGSENIPFCPLHSGTSNVDQGSAAVGLAQLAVIDTTPVRTKELVLLGEDPYYTEQLTLDGVEHQPARTSNNVLDSFDLGDAEKPLQFAWPKRLVITPE